MRCVNLQGTTGQGETWTWGLGRYAMATFTYRFNDLSR